MGASEAKRKKQNKKNENETKNIFAFCKDGIKECNGQDPTIILDLKLIIQI